MTHPRMTRPRMTRPPHSADEFAGAIGGLCGDAIDGLFILVGTIGALSVALAISACMIRKVQHKKAANE